MKIRRSAALAGLIGLGFSAGLVLVGGGAAYAATTPPWEPDTSGNSAGTLAFYDASGNQITSGSITASPMAAYYVGSAAGRAGDSSTLIRAAQPNPNANIALWNKDNLGNQVNYPITTGPANIQTLSNTHPVSIGAGTDLSLNDFIGEFPNTDPSGAGCAYAGTASGCTNTAYQNLYTIRLYTANGSNVNGQYEQADVLVNPSAGTWTQVFPAVAQSTTTTLSGAPNPATTTQTVTLTATEAPAAAGSVQFKDGATNIGSPVAVNGSGVATTTTTFSTTGAHSLSAVFTPTDTSSFSGSTGTFTENVNAPSTPTHITVAATQDGTAGHDVTLTAVVTPSAAVGTVAFFDNGSTTALPGTVTQNPAGTYTLDLPTGLGAGQHTIVATFTASNPANFQSSTTDGVSPDSGPAQFFLSAAATGACDNTGGQRISTDPRTNLCTDLQGIQVTVPVGTLVITTPYTTGSPLDLGTMALINNSSEWQATGTFQNIQVNDTRAGNLPYSINALCSTLSTTATPPSGTVNTINAENVGLTNLIEADSNGYAGVSTPHNNAAADPAVQPSDAGSLGLGGTTGHDIFDTTHGVGTVTLNGTLTINAPLNTAPGLYKGTITFTVG